MSEKKKAGVARPFPLRETNWLDSTRSPDFEFVEAQDVAQDSYLM
jgi:hypothetical protein